MVFVYRSGKLPTLEKVANRNALWFDQLTTIPTGCSPRSVSVFASLTQEEATGWVDWRLDAGLDASIWRFEIPDNMPVYLHPVRAYEDARFVESLMGAGDLPYDSTKVENYAKEYWLKRIPVTLETVVPSEAFWEILVPHSVAENAKWELVEYVSDNYRETVPTYFG